jgi:molybdopterin biosynthesis enzyme
MIELSKALNIIKRETKPLGIEIVRLERSIGRVLAEDILPTPTCRRSIARRWMATR